MALKFSHFKQILERMLSYVVGHSKLSDVNPGSVLRTLLEANAIEMAQIYVQLQNLLNLFSIDKSSGTDLDERALDFGLTREQPAKSVGEVTIGDSDLTTADQAISTLSADLDGGDDVRLFIQTDDWADFPASGTVIVDRDNNLREYVTYTSKSSPNKLECGGPASVFDHFTGATVILSTVGSDRTIPSGTVVKSIVPDLKFDTTEEAVLLDGDISVDVPIQSQETGEQNNVSAGTIVEFEALPFPTATVTNADKLHDGADLESDEDFRARIKAFPATLSSSTVRRIVAEALKVVIEETGQRVVTAKLIEPIDPGAMTLYINDGTTDYTPTQGDVLETEVIVSVAKPDQTRAHLDNWPVVADTLVLVGSVDQGVATAVDDSVTDATIVDDTKSWTIDQYIGFKVKDENDVFWDIETNTATALGCTPQPGLTPALGAYAIIDPTSPLIVDTDYLINLTNGDLELTDNTYPTGLPQYGCLVAWYDGMDPAYNYFDGLLQKVQHVLNGDPTDFDTYPGVIAGGSRVDILAPSTIAVTVVVAISAEDGFDEASIKPLVKTAIVNYINSLNIGEDVIHSKIVEVAMAVTGVHDATVSTPSANVVITDSQLAKTSSATVTVS